MKNLFRFALIALFIVGLVYTAEAANDYASPNVEIFGTSGGPSGTTPPTQITRVRYSYTCQLAQDANGNVSSGDVMVWDYNSADGITVSKCVVDSNGTGDYLQHFAGVAVTNITSADTTTKNGIERNWGYIATKGYCLAKVDTSESGSGEKLALGGGTLVGSFQTIVSGNIAIISEDIGQLISDTGSDGLMPVRLK